VKPTPLLTLPPTPARTPSRTLVDPLEAFVNQFISSPTDFPRAVQAAKAAAAETATYEAKAGRAAYVGREQLKNAQVPDPGAHGVAVLLGGLLKAI
jgi:triose/dihydroxyacetone kinase / FAD-AMP lyase (cyclizing)